MRNQGVRELAAVTVVLLGVVAAGCRPLADLRPSSSTNEGTITCTSRSITVRIYNAGPVEAAASVTRFAFNGIPSIDVETPVVPTNGSVDVTLDLPRPAPNPLVFAVVADAGETVPESSETNNGLNNQSC